MNHGERIISLLEAQQKELQEIHCEIQKVNSRLDALEESAEITRDGVNAILEWAEDVGNSLRFPLPKIAK